MQRLLISAFALLVGSSAYAELLTPRYRQVIGVDLFVDLLATTFGCPLPDGSKRMYHFDRKRKGALIMSAREGSPAQKAGLQCRDIVVAVDGQRVVYASEMGRMVASATDNHVEVSYISPRDRADIAMDIVYDETIKTIIVETTSLDEVAEKQKLGTVETNFNIADVFGPKFIFDTRTSFEEISPGIIRYTCSLSHRGDQEFLPIESPLLPYLGVTEMFINLTPKHDRTFVRDADVATEGIPVLTTIKLGVARRINTDGANVAGFIAKHPRSAVTRVEGVDGREHFYSWQDTNIKCFLPEKLSRELEHKERRLRSAW